MKRRNQRTAVILLFSILMGMIFQGIPYAEPKAQVSSESYHFTEGEAVEPYSVDLSGVNTMATGSKIGIEVTNLFPQYTDMKYFSSIRVSYKLTYKDQSKMEEELAKEEERLREETFDDSITLSEGDWFVRTAYCSLDVKNSTDTTIYESSDTTLDFSKCQISLDDWKNNSKADSTIKYQFRIAISSYANFGPLQVDTIQVTSIEFIPYENAVYGEKVVKPTASPKPENDLADPQTPIPTEKDYSIKTGNVENFSVNLNRYQTSFSRSWIYFDLRDEFGVNWYRQENYSAVRINYQVEYFEESERPENSEANYWFLESIKFAMVDIPEEIDGYSGDYYESTKYIARPWIGTEVIIPFEYNDYIGEFGEVPQIVGINIQPLSYRSQWPEEVKSVSITGIEFIAKEDAVYPTSFITPEPSVSPTPTVTVTPTVTPKNTETPIISPVTTAPPLPTGAVDNKIQKVQNVKAKVAKAKSVKLSWKPIREADGYEIYRSTKKSSGFKKIATVAWNKDNFTDQKVKRNQTYYYKVRAYASEGNSRVYGPYSACRKQMVRRKAPSFTLKKKKTPQGISYISIHMKTWSDPNVEIRVRKKKKKYVKIPLTHPNIKKNKKVFNFQYYPGRRCGFR